MTNTNFDFEDLKVDYLSFNLQFNNPEKIQKISDFLADTFHCRSTLLDQSSKKWHLLTETNKNRYSAEFVVNSNKHWKGSILRFKGRHAEYFYKDLKFQKLDWSIFDFDDTNLGLVDLCYDRKLKESDRVEDFEAFLSDAAETISSGSRSLVFDLKPQALRIGHSKTCPTFFRFHKNSNGKLITL